MRYIAILLKSSIYFTSRALFFFFFCQETFKVLNSNAWLVATIVDGAVLDEFRGNRVAVLVVGKHNQDIPNRIFA